jgi:CRP-like cAMP-binding protein
LEADLAEKPDGVFVQPKTGLGTGIVKALAQQLGAEVETLAGPEGTTVRPLTPLFWQRCPVSCERRDHPQSSNRRDAACSRRRVEMTFVEPKEAPMGKPANDVFDAKVFLAKVGAGKTILKFHKNQKVFAQGEVADTIFYIQKGRIKLTVLSEQGKEAVVAILEPGQFFGEGCMNGHPLRIATTTAMEECVITSITKEAMIAVLHEEPTFTELFLAYLLTRNSRIEEDLIDQLFNSSERRLARLLLLLAHFGKDGSPQPILVDISQETLAEMIGTTRSRVSAFMNKFRKLGLISYNGHIEVHNSLLNAVLHEKPQIDRDESTSKV